MHRVDGLDHVANMFDEGDPMEPREATQVTVDWLNDVQENLARAVERSGQSLVKGNYDQLANALGAKASCVFRFTTGGAVTILESDGIASLIPVSGSLAVLLSQPVEGWPRVVVQDMGQYAGGPGSTGPRFGVPNYPITPVPDVEPIAGFEIAFFTVAGGTGVPVSDSSLDGRIFAVSVFAKRRIIA